MIEAHPQALSTVQRRTLSVDVSTPVPTGGRTHRTDPWTDPYPDASRNSIDRYPIDLRSATSSN